MNKDYRKLLDTHGLRISMSGLGTWYDNASTASFFTTPKNDLVHYRLDRSHLEANKDLFAYIEMFNNSHDNIQL